MIGNRIWSLDQLIRLLVAKSGGTLTPAQLRADLIRCRIRYDQNRYKAVIRNAALDNDEFIWYGTHKSKEGRYVVLYTIDSRLPGAHKILKLFQGEPSG